MTPRRLIAASAAAIALGLCAAPVAQAQQIVHDPTSYANRVARLGQVVPASDGRLIDAEGLTVEEFGLPDNLMMMHALDLHGSPLVTPREPSADLWHDLTSFEACVRLAAAQRRQSAK